MGKTWAVGTILLKNGTRQKVKVCMELEFKDGTRQKLIDSKNWTMFHEPEKPGRKGNNIRTVLAEPIITHYPLPEDDTSSTED